MHLPSPQTVADGGGPIESIARTFGIDWPHLIAQAISFGIVCVVLYLFAYKPILRMLEARRQQIADGLANAQKIKAELARIDEDRRAVLAAADADSRQMIEEARTAAARAGAEETQKATAAAELVLARAHEAAERDRARLMTDAQHEIGRLVIRTTAAVIGKVLTADDQQRLAEETARQLTV
jgi:F-type H+-transporting ATPase subunit b